MVGKRQKAGTVLVGMELVAGMGWVGKGTVEVGV